MKTGTTASDRVSTRFQLLADDFRRLGFVAARPDTAALDEALTDGRSPELGADSGRDLRTSRKTTRGQR